MIIGNLLDMIPILYPFLYAIIINEDDLLKNNIVLFRKKVILIKIIKY
jgi:hypothetical protein